MPFVRVLTAADGQITVDYNYLSDPAFAENATPTAAQMTVTQVRWTNNTAGTLTIQPRKGDGTVQSPQTVLTGGSGTFTFGSALGGVGGVAISVRS